ncbi:MAG: hypothetical protein QGH47_06750, partial [Candidatus Woesearchaeota archaeon]|nr:hypothetical protein [Candidatus Woesearchaeota archaeon]
LDEVGEKTITVTMGGQQEDLSVLVFDKAGVSIINVDAPDQVRYDDEFPLIYSLKKSSFADVNNIRVEIESATKTSFSVENLKDIINMDVKLRGSDIINDEVLITVSFEDKQGNSFENQQKVKISLVDLSLMQKISMFFKKLFG